MTNTLILTITDDQDNEVLFYKISEDRETLKNAAVEWMQAEYTEIFDQTVRSEFPVDEITNNYDDLNHFFGPLKMRGSVTSDTYLEPGSVFDTQDYYGDGAHYTAAATAQ